jgi:hypothetical protein
VAKRFTTGEYIGPSPEPGRAEWRLGKWIPAFGMIMVVLASLTSAGCTLSGLGSHEPDPGVRVENRTDSELVIYAIASPTEVQVGTVAPGSILATETCPSDGFVARTPGGEEVARWDSDRDCDELWVIRDS